ncbi:similar to Saccharomyces cerevisiae YDR086C SSS1 Subunit of the Sec61p translocation complex that forms a channel for passage of secretory proteins through the endoplasmic reticulum membrane [Geotrichum candidum]|uniref:Similar to Saccharomyces cerevisiae YDR086C SSS1 Subunit of the Sec61p translocation complex that forms a channel for passage of secretory proteins through the endoplasmic reticulum membrane n=1 Tax=Geotrichum candidum TaxID=1173061 RepID=A0A0J9X8F3_GEOCN|nr:similar to Saccharomyces cerevisiae YDR086C SSS1 Subunit of the Sec61p translocation complex that forms a channel for passage of secretory proteins through the endoplasmic reticulum membrane [Geotrichum candidum]
MAGDGLEKVTEIPVEFIKEGTTFLNRCTKPDCSEFIKIIRAVGVGFIVMGAIGYIVKLIHIPIRHLITV